MIVSIFISVSRRARAAFRRRKTRNRAMRFVDSSTKANRIIMAGGKPVMRIIAGSNGPTDE